MKKLMLAAALLGTSLFSQAATQADLLKEKLARLYSYQASFQQTVTDASGKPVQTEGEGMLSVKQPSMFRFETIAPEPNVFVGNGVTLWHHNQVLEQVSIYDAKKEVNVTPFVLLTSNDPTLWSNYEVSGSGEEFIIRAKDPASAVPQLTLQFAGVGFSKMTVLDQNGQTSVFEFLAVQNNIKLDSSLFKLELPANVDIEDLRKK